MSGLKLAGIVGTGGLGVLAAGFIGATLLNLSIAWIFGACLFIFVVAGAVALLARSGVIPV